MSGTDLGLHGDAVIRSRVSTSQFRDNYDAIDWGTPKPAEKEEVVVPPYYEEFDGR